MKLKDLLKIVSESQFIEFNYKDNEGYITGFDIPLYRHGESNVDTILELLDFEVEEMYSNVECYNHEVEYDYIVVVLNKEDK